MNEKRPANPLAPGATRLESSDPPMADGTAAAGTGEALSNGSTQKHRYGRLFRWITWGIYLVAWSAALLTPYPVFWARAVLPEAARFPAAKLLHVTAYAVLTILSGWLRVPARSRPWLLLFLSTHALATEFFQRFVALRGASWRDVGLNHLGLLLGLILSHRWWRMTETANSGPPPPPAPQAPHPLGD